MNDGPYRSPNADETSVPVSPAASSTWSSLALKVLVVGGILFVFVCLLLPTQRGAREAARRSSCANNLKQIGIALQNYADANGAFPPAYTVDENGKRLHSWRTLILPYLESSRLYESIDLTKPWDDPINAAAAKTKVKTYQCPSVPVADRQTSDGQTTYLAVVTSGSCLGAEPRKLEDITDGPHATIMVIEVPADRAVPWMSPEDADESLVLAFSQATPPPHPYGAQAAFVDGHVQLIPTDLTAAQRRALISIAGNDDADLD